MKLIASKKFQGVYHQELKNNDVSYIIRYKSNNKLRTVKIGNKSQGISEKPIATKKEVNISIWKN